MRAISVEILRDSPTSGRDIEIVERKGTGHPDYICDAVMDEISVALCREYIKEFGDILHHNIDKGMLIAGRVKRDFGGGEVLKPMELIVGDRATFRVGKQEIPVCEIAERTARGWFKEKLPHVDPERDLSVRVVLSPGSEELRDIFSRKGRIRGANDTSAVVGYAPLTATEKAVYDTERFLNSPVFKEQFPETGEDVKVMGLRKGNELDLTVAMPLMSGEIEDEEGYFRVKSRVVRALRCFVSGMHFENVRISYNALDRRGHGLNGVYLSLLGTSAEDADSGQVGRGNRTNGVISLNRPMGTEAAAGKNPVSHVGKIYNILSHRIAGSIYDEIEGVREVYVWLLSQIGKPIDSPHLASVQLILRSGMEKKRVEKGVKGIIESAFSRIGEFTGELAQGRYPVC